MNKVYAIVEIVFNGEYGGIIKIFISKIDAENYLFYLEQEMYPWQYYQIEEVEIV